MRFFNILNPLVGELRRTFSGRYLRLLEKLLKTFLVMPDHKNAELVEGFGSFRGVKRNLEIKTGLYQNHKEIKKLIKTGVQIIKRTKTTYKQNLIESYFYTNITVKTFKFKQLYFCKNQALPGGAYPIGGGCQYYLKLCYLVTLQSIYNTYTLYRGNLFFSSFES